MRQSVKTHASASKAAKNTDVASQQSSSGKNGAAFAPPAYGIDYIDVGGRPAEGLAPTAAHVIQQTSAGSNNTVTASSSEPRLARSVDDWLTGSVNLSALTYTQLVSDVDELTQYQSRQTSSSPDTIRIEEALSSLRAEVSRRDAVTSGSRPHGRGRSRERGRTTAGAGVEPLPSRYPRILTEMTSVAYRDPAEMRAEYDLIMQWLSRDETLDNERRILTAERDNLAPQLRSDRERVATERNAYRISAALSPLAEDGSHALETQVRTIQGIASEPGNDPVSYIYHQGERIAISREQAQQLRVTLVARLKRAAQDIQSRASYFWDRYNSQLAINRDSPIIAGISGWLADVEDPADELRSRCVWVFERVRTLETLLRAGDLIDAAAILAPVELVGEEIRQLSRTFYEGYIEGAEIAVHKLELTRDASFAIAGSIAAVVAAPVVAGAVGVGGLGLTGASATIATVGGTGVVVGSGMAGVRGTSAAGGVLWAGGSLSEAGSAFTAEARRGFREGFLSGAGGAAARSVGLAINAAGGTLAKQVATRVGAEMLINGITTMVDVLARGGTIEEAASAAVIAVAQAVPGALLGGSNNPVVRKLLAPFTAGATAYLAARASGASPEYALAQAGVALAANIAMSRALHTPGTDAALVERGRSIGAGVRKTVVSTAHQAKYYAAAVMIGTSDALPPLRSGYGGAPVVIGRDLAGVTLVSPPTPKTALAETTAEVATPTHVVPRAETETVTPATAVSQVSGEVAAPVVPHDTDMATPAAPSVPTASSAAEVTPQAPAPAQVVRRESTGARSTARASSSAQPAIEDAARMGFIDPALAVPGVSASTATSRTPRSQTTAIRAQTAELTAYDARLSRGEIGLLAPVGANVPGADYATAVRLANGDYEVVVVDAKSRVSSTSDFGDVRTSLPASWRDSVVDAIAPGRLKIGDPVIEQGIRDAWSQGRVRIARDTIDYSSQGQGNLRLDN